MAIRVHVISLSEADRRRRHVMAQLDALGCDYEFFDAIGGARGAEHFETVDARRHLINTGRLPTPGEVGCYASHLALWNKCVADNRPFCVLEDDCRLEDFFPAALEKTSQLIGQYGFIRLQTEFRAKKKLVLKTDGFDLFRYTKMAHSTLAYAIAPAVAKSFVEHSTTMRCPVDVFIKRFWEHGRTLYGLTPYAARESALAGETSIEDRSRPRKDLVTRIARVGAKADGFLRRAAFNRAFGAREPE